MANYRYTQDNGILSDSQRKFYEENGFIVFKKLIPDEDIEACKRRFIEICNGGDNQVMTLMKDQTLKKKGNVKGEFLVNKVQEILYDDVFFNNYAAHKNIIEIVTSIIGPNISGAHSMLINKPPDSSYDHSRHPLHQDLHYFPFRPADKIVASWTAMEKINLDNGCLFVIPGSHKSKLYPHVYPPGKNNAMYHGVQGFDHVPKVHLIMEKGDTVFFHPLILHGSEPNKTKGFRKAISVHYADSNCYFMDVRGTTQGNIAEEAIQIVKKKTGNTVKYEDIWKYKSRLIAGSPGTFQNLTSNL